ncbi:hypothetical protein Fcan01_25395 [Folsomia candida]|uniref:Uncharacterized protein n=1 Tax=Folsomia candida TaxID=158441 RepID=A0A226D4E8_FOLCA|nr:hypothetical protein Fcan01_25395 [Folsomia candida]
MGTTINDITISPGCSPPTDTNSPLSFPQVCPNTELEPLPTPAAPLPANIFVPPHILPSFQPVPPHHTNAFYRPPFPPSHISTIDGDFCACPPHISHIDNLTGWPTPATSSSYDAVFAHLIQALRFTSIQDCNAHPPFVNPRSTNDPHFVSLLAQQLPSQLQQGIGTSDMRPHVVSAGSDSIHMLDAPRPRSSGQHMTFPDSPPTGGFRHNNYQQRTSQGNRNRNHRGRSSYSINRGGGFSTRQNVHSQFHITAPSNHWQSRNTEFRDTHHIQDGVGRNFGGGGRVHSRRRYNPNTNRPRSENHSLYSPPNAHPRQSRYNSLPIHTNYNPNRSSSHIPNTRRPDLLTRPNQPTNLSRPLSNSNPLPSSPSQRLAPHTAGGNIPFPSCPDCVASRHTNFSIPHTFKPGSV